MGLDGLSLNSYWRVGYWEGENRVAYWCMPLLRFLFSHSLFFPSLSIFSFWFLCYLFSFLSFLLLFFLTLSYLFLFVISCACPSSHPLCVPRPFYTACHDRFYYFTPKLLLFGCKCLSQTIHWFVSCLAITTFLC